MRCYRSLCLYKGHIYARIANALSRSGLFKFDPRTVQCDSCTACGDGWGNMLLSVCHHAICTMLSSHILQINSGGDINAVVERIWKDK